MSVANPNTPSQQSGPTLDGVALEELYPCDGPAAKTASVHLRDSDIPQTHKRIPEQGDADTRLRRQALMPF